MVSTKLRPFYVIEHSGY